MFVVEPDIPTPKGRMHTNLTEALRSMVPGESVFIPFEYDSHPRGGVYYAASSYGYQFVDREERNGIRVWRVS